MKHHQREVLRYAHLLDIKTLLDAGRIDEACAALDHYVEAINGI